MNIRHNEPLREKLASEYVLGTLKGGARRRFESWLASDAALRRAVAEWQDRLYPLAELAPAVAPPSKVWQGIEKHLDREQAARSASAQSRWFDSLRFWRGLGLASTALAVALAALLIVRDAGFNGAPPNYIAVLADNQAHQAMVVRADARLRVMTINVVAPQNIADDKSLELWALPKEGPPRSLGLLAANGVISLTLPADVSPQSVPALAVSLEPKGGSPNPNAPSGPVVLTGAWVKI